MSADKSSFYKVLCGCGAELERTVYESAAGFFYGTWCRECGPDRESHFYFPTREKAAQALTEWEDAETA